MGYSTTAYLVAGVPYNVYYEERSNSVQTTRYDQNTGVPFQKTVVLTQHLILGEEIPEVQLYRYLETPKTVFGAEFRLFRRTCEDGPVYFGICVSDVEPGKDCSIEKDACDHALHTMKQFLSARGISVEPKLYLILYESY